MKEKIIVIGGGGHAKVIISILKKLDRFKIVGFTDNEKKEAILGVPYLGDDRRIDKYITDGISNSVVGLGQINDVTPRKRVIEKYGEKGFNFPTIISPQSIINEDVEIGKGTVVMDGVVINSGCRIGEFSIINTKSSIDHDCNIGSFTHIAPGVTLSGGVEVGNDSMVGVGSTVLQYKIIGSNIIVGAGSLVNRDILEFGVYYGCPIRKIK